MQVPVAVLGRVRVSVVRPGRAYLSTNAPRSTSSLSWLGRCRRLAVFRPTVCTLITNAPRQALSCVLRWSMSSLWRSSWSGSCCGCGSCCQSSGRVSSGRLVVRIRRWSVCKDVRNQLVLHYKIIVYTIKIRLLFGKKVGEVIDYFSFTSNKVVFTKKSV